jgi:lipoyl(octanoyl) transferase
MLLRKFGTVEYTQMWEQMKFFCSCRTLETEDELWLCQHFPVYTLGTKAARSNILHETDIPIIQTDRGGEVTYHGPGQLMIYPLIDLKRNNLYPKEYLSKLLDSVSSALRKYRVETLRVDHAPGLFVRKSGGAGQFKDLVKIASVGLKITNHCSYHGVALNVDLDLTNFRHINPCGYGGLRMSSLKELGVSAPFEEISGSVAQSIFSTFQ